MSHKQIGNSGIDRPALSSIMNETHFFSHNARNVFRASSFLEQLGEPKMNHFFSCNHPLTLQYYYNGATTYNWHDNKTKGRSHIVTNELSFCM